jgi:DNA-binding transcriptional MocR family regulator
MDSDPGPVRKIPRYQEIARHFEQAIDTHDLMPGQKLPPIPRIAEQFGVATETAAKAVRDLRDKGYVQTSTQGTIVLDRLRVGVFGAEVLPPRHMTGCRSTIHCASFGFCHRCSPELAEASSHVMLALATVGQERNGGLYERVMNLLKADG